jgi:hypothetical protein
MMKFPILNRLGIVIHTLEFHSANSPAQALGLTQAYALAAYRPSI